MEHVDRASLGMQTLQTLDKVYPTIEFHTFYFTELFALANYSNHVNLEMPNATTSSSPTGVAVSELTIR